jgi:hypothetical protein
MWRPSNVLFATYPKNFATERSQRDDRAIRDLEAAEKSEREIIARLVGKIARKRLR